MLVEHLLAVVPVSDIERAAAWYERLFGNPPTNRPMPSLVEWRVTDSGWVQVFADKERAGRTALNLAVADLGVATEVLGRRGLVAGEIQVANKGVRLAASTDLDGNAITLISGFREVY